MTEPLPPAPRASFADEREIDHLIETLGRFERRELDAEAWRAYRVVRGVYSQRQDGVHMLRTKLPQGIATAEQLRALAEVARRWSRGFGHVTTRQNFQLHFLRPADLDASLRRLAAAGVTTAGAGGNAVRNVVACPFAGVSADEAFDVTPYAEAVTRHFLRHPLASALPRKFKIAFEGCREDHVSAAINDLGFRAVVRDGRRGFSVTVAGGTSSLCTSGTPLVEFLPAGELLALAEAVVRVFHARGDRKNKLRNRLKFLVRDLGFEAFRALVEAERAALGAGAPALPFDPESPPAVGPPARRAPAANDAAEQPALALFRETNVRPQRQAGYAVVTVAPPQGDLDAAQLEALAAIAERSGEGAVRFGIDGHVHLRFVPDAEVATVFAALEAAGLGRAGAGGPADVVSCPGSEACRMAVTHTRGIARAVEERIRASGDREVAAPVSVHASGCPNGCSQHHVAAIGLQGGARKVGAIVIPQYFVLVGGGVDGAARFGKLVGKVPARRVPDAVERLVALYLSRRAPGETAHAFFGRETSAAAAAIAPLCELSPGELRPEDRIEPGLTTVFAPETAEGECAA